MPSLYLVSSECRVFWTITNRLHPICCRGAHVAYGTWPLRTLAEELYLGSLTRIAVHWRHHVPYRIVLVRLDRCRSLPIMGPVSICPWRYRMFRGTAVPTSYKVSLDPPNIDKMPIEPDAAADSFIIDAYLRSANSGIAASG